MLRVEALSQNAVWQPLAVKVLRFPGGEMHVTAQADIVAEALRITAPLQRSDDVMSLLMLTDALRRAYRDVPLTLIMPYVPYARQDRVANDGEALSIKVFCGLINAQGYARVVIQDPHSDVTAALLDRVVIDDPLPSLRAVLDDIGDAILLAPDAGARKRVMKLAAALNVGVAFADKVRDTRTGAITGTQIQDALPRCAVLVVDDICDGGRTFTELAKVIAARQAEQQLDQARYLYVTHGIFSKGLDPLLAGYERVFTRNNWTEDTRCTLV